MAMDCKDQLTTAQSRIAELEAENATLKEDAERYRYLRDDGHGFDISVMERTTEYDEWWVHGYPPEELDAAIDAARKGGEASGVG